jgi:hypothetical protein
MTTLRQRMIDAMVLRGFRPRTQVSYLRAVAQMARHYHRSPEQITDEEIKAYLLHLVKDRRLARTSVNRASRGRALSRVRGAGPGRPAISHSHGADTAEAARRVVPRGGGGGARGADVHQGAHLPDDDDPRILLSKSRSAGFSSSVSMVRLLPRTRGSAGAVLMHQMPPDRHRAGLCIIDILHRPHGSGSMRPSGQRCQ